jgi:hypothetical protein
MHRVIHRPSTQALKGVVSKTTPTKTKTQPPLPWDAIALFLEGCPKVDLRAYPQLGGVMGHFKNAPPVYCVESVPSTLQALLSARFKTYDAGSAFMSVGTHEAIMLDFSQIRQCSQRLGCGLEAAAIASFLHEYGHYLAMRSGLPNDEATAWGWARRLNVLHGFVTSQLLIDLELLIGA